jgi:hypothetical protein
MYRMRLMRPMNLMRPDEREARRNVMTLPQPEGLSETIGREAKTSLPDA